MAYNYGQLGDGTTAAQVTPEAVAVGLFFAQVNAGGIHTCAKTVAGLAYCWGENSSGGLGDGSTTDRLTPTPVTGPVS